MLDNSRECKNVNAWRKLALPMNQHHQAINLYWVCSTALEMRHLGRFWRPSKWVLMDKEAGS
jgi:hypothetical protein